MIFFSLSQIISGLGMARPSRLVQGFVLSVILDLLFLRFLLSILKTLESTLAKPRMLWERLLQLQLLNALAKANLSWILNFHVEWRVQWIRLLILKVLAAEGKLEKIISFLLYVLKVGNVISTNRRTQLLAQLGSGGWAV